MPGAAPGRRCGRCTTPVPPRSGSGTGLPSGRGGCAGSSGHPCHARPARPTCWSTAPPSGSTAAASLEGLPISPDELSRLRVRRRPGLYRRAHGARPRRPRARRAGGRRPGVAGGAGGAQLRALHRDGAPLDAMRAAVGAGHPSAPPAGGYGARPMIVTDAVKRLPRAGPAPARPRARRDGGPRRPRADPDRGARHRRAAAGPGARPGGSPRARSRHRDRRLDAVHRPWPGRRRDDRLLRDRSRAPPGSAHLP